MCSFRLEKSTFEQYKAFCTRNNITIKESLTKVIELILEADVIENDRDKNLLDVQTT